MSGKAELSNYWYHPKPGWVELLRKKVLSNDEFEVEFTSLDERKTIAFRARPDMTVEQLYDRIPLELRCKIIAFKDQALLPKEAGSFKLRELGIMGAYSRNGQVLEKPEKVKLFGRSGEFVVNVRDLCSFKMAMHPVLTTDNEIKAAVKSKLDFSTPHKVVVLGSDGKSDWEGSTNYQRLWGHENAEVNVIVKPLLVPRTEMQIFVQLIPLGKSLTLDVGRSETINLVKHKIESKVDIPADRQLLVFGSYSLEGDRTLADYKIDNCASIQMMLRLRGGMFLAISGRNGFELLHPANKDWPRQIMNEEDQALLNKHI